MFNKKTLIALALIGVQNLEAAPFAAGTELNCTNVQTKKSLKFKALDLHSELRTHPFDDGMVSLSTEGGPLETWLWLESHQKGSLTSKHNYVLQHGGKLVISESVRFGRGGCGRGSCDDSGVAKSIAAELSLPRGETHVFACYQPIKF